MMRHASLRADNIALAMGLGALALILGALGFQYIGGVAPCEMCHWQRWPHIAAAIIGIAGGAVARAVTGAKPGLARDPAGAGFGPDRSFIRAGMQWGIAARARPPAAAIALSSAAL